MSILVIAEHDHQSLKAATLNTVAAAARIGGEIHVLVAGTACADAAQQAAGLQGVAKVKVADAPHYQSQTAENLAALVVANAAGYTHILAPATPFAAALRASTPQRVLTSAGAPVVPQGLEGLKALMDQPKTQPKAQPKAELTE